MKKTPRVLGKVEKVVKIQSGGDPHFKGATPEKLARALMRRTRPLKPADKRDARTGVTTSRSG